MNIFLTVGGIALLLFAPVAVSFIVEALRREPDTPAQLFWAPEIALQYVEAAGHRLRYVKTGSGPNVVLLHTLRTQLDIFHKVIPGLARRFTVYALDYPGHGHSDIPDATYDPQLFVDAVAAFLEALDIKDATLAGVSIGGVIPLLIAARHNQRVKRVVSINPYDYGGGGGVGRSSPAGALLFRLGRIPVLGETFMRLRNPMVENLIFDGGVAEPEAISPELRAEMSRVGNRPGHYRAFLNLIRHSGRWADAHAQYPNIRVPVLLVYGERDWSRGEERQRTLAQIPGARLETVPGGNHFLSLDRPREVERLIADFAAGNVAAS